MNQLLMAYGLVFMMVLAMLLLAVRRDGAFSERLARVRVRIEENQRRDQFKSADEDLRSGRKIELLVLSILLLLICMLLIKV